jgi:hypothetical protein
MPVKMLRERGKEVEIDPVVFQVWRFNKESG